MDDGAVKRVPVSCSSNQFIQLRILSPSLGLVKRRATLDKVPGSAACKQPALPLGAKLILFHHAPPTCAGKETRPSTAKAMPRLCDSSF